MVNVVEQGTGKIPAACAAAGMMIAKPPAQ